MLFQIFHFTARRNPRKKVEKCKIKGRFCGSRIKYRNGLLQATFQKQLTNTAEEASVKEVTKVEETSLSDFTLCGAKLLPKLAPIH